MQYHEQSEKCKFKMYNSDGSEKNRLFVRHFKFDHNIEDGGYTK